MVNYKSHIGWSDGKTIVTNHKTKEEAQEHCDGNRILKGPQTSYGINGHYVDGYCDETYVTGPYDEEGNRIPRRDQGYTANHLWKTKNRRLR